MPDDSHIPSRIRTSTDTLTREDRISAWARKWAFPALLCGIAIQQMLAVVTLGLTPWKGGGFGMFSSVDSAHARILRVEGAIDGRSMRLDLASTQENPWTERASRFALGQLTESNLRRLVRRLASIAWVPIGIERSFLAAGEPPKSDAVVPDFSSFAALRPFSDKDRWLPAGAARRLDRVRAQVWRLRFDPASRELTFVAAGPVVEESGAD